MAASPTAPPWNFGMFGGRNVSGRYTCAIPIRELAPLQTRKTTSSRRIWRASRIAAGAQNAGQNTEMYSAAWASPDASELVDGWAIEIASQQEQKASHPAAGYRRPPAVRRPEASTAPQAARGSTQAMIRVSDRYGDRAGTYINAGRTVWAITTHSSQPMRGIFGSGGAGAFATVAWGGLVVRVTMRTVAQRRRVRSRCRRGPRRIQPSFAGRLWQSVATIAGAGGVSAHLHSLYCHDKNPTEDMGR